MVICNFGININGTKLINSDIKWNQGTTQARIWEEIATRMISGIGEIEENNLKIFCTENNRLVTKVKYKYNKICSNVLSLKCF